MNDFKYNLDRGRTSGEGSRRLRLIILFILVLAATCGIVYYLIPRETGKSDAPSVDAATKTGGIPETATSQNAQGAPETNAPDTSANASSATTANAAAEVADAPTADAGAGEPGTGTQGSREAAQTAAANNATDPAATQYPEKGKPWIGDPPEPPTAGAPDANVQNDPALMALRSGDISGAAEKIIVKSGDSLSRLALRHHTTVEALRHFNRLTGDKIRIGQKLYAIPGPWRIIVDKSGRKLILERSADGKWQQFVCFQVGLGRMDKTPEAEFVVSSRLRHPTWYAPDGRVFRYGDPENQLGDYFIKLAESGTPDRPLLGYGIHGAVDDSTVGKNWSNGCVRMHNREVEILYYLVPAGTPVKIISGDKGTVKSENRQ